MINIIPWIRTLTHEEKNQPGSLILGVAGPEVEARKSTSRHRISECDSPSFLDTEMGHPALPSWTSAAQLQHMARELLHQGLHGQKAVPLRPCPVGGCPLAMTKQGVGKNSRHLGPAQDTPRGSMCSRAPHGVDKDFGGRHHNSTPASVQTFFPVLPSADADSKETPQTLISVSVPASVTYTTNFTNRGVC